MVLRLILVGLVAGLGSEMPTRSDLNTMARTAQQWMNARLVELDRQSAPALDAAVFVIEPAASAPLPAASVSISDQEFADVLGETVALFARDERAGKALETDSMVKSRDEIAVADSSPSLAIDLPTAPVSVASDEPMITDRAFAATIEATVQQFTVTAAAPVETNELTNELDQCFKGVVEQVVQSFDRDASVPAGADPITSGEPLEVDENLYAGEAFALNRLSDGIQEPIAAPDPSVRSEDRLTHAVRLTREAVFAWASLIHGPAVVTMAR